MVVSLSAGIRIQLTEVTDLGIFQEQVNELAKIQTDRSLMRNSNTSFVPHSISNKGIAASVLDAKSDVSDFRGGISSVSFHANGQKFVQHSVDTLQILHFRTEEGLDRVVSGSELLHQYHYQAMFYLLSEATQENQILVRMDRKTNCIHMIDSDIVAVVNVVCQSENADGSKDRIRCSKVEVKCATSKVAQRLVSIIKLVTHQLQVHYLQYPRLGESVLAQKDCADLFTDDTYLSNPQAIVVFDPETKLYRLILRSNSLASSVTMELPNSFVNALHDSSVREVVTRLQANFVEHDLEGTSIETRPARFPADIERPK